MLGSIQPLHLVPSETGRPCPFSTAELRSRSAGRAAPAPEPSRRRTARASRTQNPRFARAWTIAGSASSVTAARRNAAFFCAALDQVHLGAGLSGQRASDHNSREAAARSRGRPSRGRSARAREAAANRRRGESRSEESSRMPTRLVDLCHLSSRSTNCSSRSHVSRETVSPNKAMAWALSWALGSADRCAGHRRWRRRQRAEVAADFRLSAPHMRDQERQRRRRHAVDPPRLADRPGPDRFQLLPHFHRQRRHAPNNRGPPAAPRLRHADRPPRRPPGGRDRPHTWRRFRPAARCFRGNFGELRPDPRMTSAMPMFGYDRVRSRCAADRPCSTRDHAVRPRSA